MSTPSLRMVVYGKGGIGKSTIAANLSFLYARQGLKVLHVGCDPKHDSTYTLVENHPIPTIVERFLEASSVPGAEAIVTAGRQGIDCLEAGGPTPGTGCGGRGVMLATEVLKSLDLCAKDRYDVAVFDVVGDVVCGGFAAPVQHGLGNLVFIVVSGDIMSLYAGNNVARVVVRYAGSGVRLGGIICNNLRQEGDKTAMEEFARRLNSKILQYLPFSADLKAAEYQRTPVTELHPGCEFSRGLEDLAKKILELDPDGLAAPNPMSDGEFDEFVRATFHRE
jgi:nitrogenase iron protein NifH